MDSGARIYASLLGGATAHLSRVNPKLANEALDWNLKTLETEGVVYGVENGVLNVAFAEEKHRQILYYTLLSLAESFERQYGITETWMPLKQVILKVMQGCREEVRSLGLEIPIARYNLEYTILDTLFGFNSSDFRSRKWEKDPVTVTNQKVTFQKGEAEEEIPYAAIATVDREIYIGYSSESIRGEIRAIDYQIKATGMSCIVVLSRKEIMRDFMKVVSVMRGEYRRLSPVESKVLIALYNNVGSGDLPKALNISETDAERAYRRIVEIGYADQGGHLTSFGINAAIETLRAVRQ